MITSIPLVQPREQPYDNHLFGGFGFHYCQHDKINSICKTQRNKYNEIYRRHRLVYTLAFVVEGVIISITGAILAFILSAYGYKVVRTDFRRIRFCEHEAPQFAEYRGCLAQACSILCDNSCRCRSNGKFYFDAQASEGVTAHKRGKALPRSTGWIGGMVRGTLE